MNPRQYEELVCEHFRKMGYDVELTPYSNDYGVDAFAIKDKQKIAVQAKMYGSSTRKVNRQMIMELHGAKGYFDCTKAVLATDGSLMPDAVTVAEKLGIEILHLAPLNIITTSSTESTDGSFETIWEQYIMPLEGRTLVRSNGNTNKILKADWGGIERITSNGKKGTIKIEIFRLTINRLLKVGSITRDEINQNYSGRASSGVVLILSQVPFFELITSPIGITVNRKLLLIMTL
ncbi:MAG: restriction endonuclease [Bacteroidota bacterium]